MQIGDNYLNDGHLPPEIPRIDGRGSFNSMSQRSLAVSFEVPDATGRMTTYVADRQGGLAWVVARGGWLQREQGDACKVGKVHIKQGRILCGRCDL